MLTLLAALSLGPILTQPADAPWQVFYEAASGFRIQPTGAWIGKATRSEWTPDGLHIVDGSTQADSGRLYVLAWQVDRAVGVVVEVRLKATQASAPWGACVNVADGVSEEDVSFLPGKVVLSYAGQEALFPAGDGFHTYKIAVKAPDIRVWADGKLILDGAGKFTHPVITPARNRLAFGASASTATSDTVWQSVRFSGGKFVSQPLEMPHVPGLEITRGETVNIRDGLSYTNMFRFASGMLSVADRRSTDGGKTWQPGSGPWVGACQLPDGEVEGLDYRTHAAPEKGWFTSALTRFDGQGRPLPALKARLHVPELVPFVDDDGSVRDGPWCDHSIILLRDGSLLAANSGCFAADQALVTTYPKEFGARKYRGFVTRSTDRGLTWEYLSTVTADPTLGPEGCNEMDLIRAPNGDILCVYRTGGSATAPSPMYLSRSRDEGRTWGKPERVADRGVWPNLCLTRDGVLVCTYGRPGNWLTFSLDSGRTWAGHSCFYDGPTTAYNSVEEVAPGTILVMYDRQAYDRGGNPENGVAGTFFSVRRR
jgi:hypothetical protein